MTALHAVLGIVCAAALAVLVVWAVVGRLALRPPGKLFERTAVVAAGLLVLQVVFGLILLALGRHREKLHYVYGAGALVVIVAGMLLARALQRDRWVVLAWAAFITGLLVMRALMTGYPS